MQIQPAYNRLSDWIRSLSTLQCVFVIWLVAIGVSIPVGVAFAGNTLTTAVASGIGGATGAAIVAYLMER
jgi:ABC-type proline/glycine betaine transport system permease subunit